ncbi:MAG: DUF2207 domain-containing protein [Balneolaceae bacterium]|nr:DUF2207 domain-containing protein [Balneolaceae bacterium]
MKRLFFTILLTVLILFQGFAQDREYQIPDIEVDVEILEDGIVQISEHRTYQFQGSYSWADYRLPKNGFAEIRNIQVLEQDRYFVNENSEEAGTFSVSDDDDSIVIRWNYNAVDTTRTFSIIYELTDALSIGPEWTEFFWNYIASGREKPTENLNIQISLPQQISTDSLHTWIRSESTQIESTQQPGHFSISADEITTDQSLQVRSVFPTQIFDESAVSITNPDLSLEWIQNDEKAYIAEQQRIEERNAYYESITPEIIILICVVSIAVFLLFYRKYGTRFSTSTISDRETVLIPDSTPPAIIGQLFGMGTATGNHLSATIFDLARRGWFKIQEEKKEKEGFFSSEEVYFKIKKSEPQPDNTLPKWEQMIVDHLNQQISRGIDRFNKLFENSDDFDMSKWFSEWKKEVKKVYDEKNWIDQKSTKGVIYNFIAQFILTAISFVFMIYGATGIAIIGLIFTSLMSFASFFIKRRTREGEQTYKRWKAYRDGLKNADKRTIQMEMMDRHFVYAMALSLSGNQIESLVKQVDGRSETIFPWIVLMPGSNHTPASVASTVSALAASSSSTFSGTAGGAGATAGSAGGGASGGAG